uniref:Uncharacterized protein n=1 Tax=Oncorhynchus tshawytscha TaxID=74940 RepID=A0AAZ3PTH5_ONCTS
VIQPLLHLLIATLTREEHTILRNTHSLVGGRRSDTHSLVGGRRSDTHSLMGGRRSDTHSLMGGRRSDTHSLVGGRRSDTHSLVGGRRSDTHSLVGGRRSDTHSLVGGRRSDTHSLVGGRRSDIFKQTQTDPCPELVGGIAPTVLVDILTAVVRNHLLLQGSVPVCVPIHPTTMPLTGRERRQGYILHLSLVECYAISVALHADTCSP